MKYVVLAADMSPLAVGFLSSWMLLWSLAAVIPILLHFWARRQQSTIRWAAMRVLQQVIEKQSRRLRVEQIVLLVIRTLVPILLAVAFARPFLESATDSAAEGLKSGWRYWIIALDTSHSMAYTGPSGVSHFEQAKAQAVDKVRDSGEGDMFSVVAMRSPPEAVVSAPVVDKQTVVESIEKLRISYTGMDLTTSLDLMEDLAGRADGDVIPSNPAVHVFSDLGVDSWGSGEELLDRLSRFNQQFELHVHPLRSESQSNAAVVDIAFPGGALIQGSKCEIGVRVEQFGTPKQSDSSRTLQLLLGKQVVASRSVLFPPDSSQVVAVEIPWTQAGAQVLTAQLDSDGLEQDDIRRQWVDVVTESRVLIVEQLRGSGLPIEVALQASALQAQSLQLKTISSIALAAEDFENWDVVVLQDVASISSEQAASLVAAVRSGLGLIILHGQQTIATSWNAIRESTPGLLAYDLRDASEEGAWAVDPLDYQSPIVAPFAGFPDSGFLTSPVFRFWQVQDTTDVVVDVAFASGQPFIMHSEVGRGRVVSVLSAPEGTPVRLGSGSAPGGEPWNVLATWPSFLPLMRSIFDFTLRNNPDRTISVGQVIKGSIGSDSQTATVKVERPSGDFDTLTVAASSQQGGRSWLYSRTDQPGVYIASSGSQAAQEYVVNIPLGESQLDSIDPSALPATKKPAPVPEDAKQLDRSSSSSIWRWLLLAVAVLLVCETCLAWWLGRRVG